ncbi:unnamed protein product [Lasius platythorax]|uniref:Uncharacterized protein n=1 Tax=Lasius platythorax TaxID=488582 RepID=A0AAV2NAF2_9HYME
MMKRAERKLQMNHKTTAGANSPRKMSGGGMISSALFLRKIVFSEFREKKKHEKHDRAYRRTTNGAYKSSS